MAKDEIKYPPITVKTAKTQLDSVGNWDGPRALFPEIHVDQETNTVSVIYLSVSNGRKGQYGMTHEHSEVLSTDGQVVRITGLTGLRNDKHSTGGRQQFCYFVFRGDSGHLYVHRSVASKGWINCDPDKLLKRLRKLGIGADKDVIQQGDFLLKPANGNSYVKEDFKHETLGAGHHKFVCPVLYADGKVGRQYLLEDAVTLRHIAVDGIKHPDIEVPAGQYIVGTTSTGLQHTNKRD